MEYLFIFVSGLHLSGRLYDYITFCCRWEIQSKNSILTNSNKYNFLSNANGRKRERETGDVNDAIAVRLMLNS